jgi:hypothetical protein
MKLLLLLAPVVLAGCGPAEPPHSSASQPADASPSWADMFDGAPDLFAVIRPRALKRDGVYGAFWDSLLRAAQARGFTRGDTMVEAVQGAEEIIVGLNRADAALVLRGVPASLDPLRMNDAEGHPLFRSISDRGRVLEYQLLDRRSAGGRGEDPGALFVLPGRTWVGTLGPARARARQVFAAPTGRPVPRVEPEALAAVRFAGPLARALERHPLFGKLTKKLTSATFALQPGKTGMTITLLYEDADGAAWGEAEAKRITAELARDEKRFGWMAAAKVAYEGNAVIVRVAVPPRLLQELPNASGADLGL